MKSLIRECRDADVALQKVEVDSELLTHMAGKPLGAASYIDVPIEGATDARAELRFFRRR